MAKIKCTMLVQATSGSGGAGRNERVGGFSESYYSDSNEFAPSIAKFQLLCMQRANLMPSHCDIIGQRYQQVDPVGVSQSGNRVYTGKGREEQDVPTLALLCKAFTTNTSNVRQLILRGLPDDQCHFGNYAPTPAFVTDLTNFVRILGTGWTMRGLKKDNQLSPILSIVEPGLVTTTIAHGLNVDDKVSILRTTQPGGRQIGGVYTVLAAPSAKTFTIAFSGDLPTKGGKARKYEVIYPPIGLVAAVGVTNRKVGRSFFPYRGRATNRR